MKRMIFFIQFMENEMPVKARRLTTVPVFSSDLPSLRRWAGSRDITLADAIRELLKIAKGSDAKAVCDSYCATHHQKP